MDKSLIADGIVTIHFVWIFYVLIGQLLILLGIALKWSWIRNFWFRFTHLTMMLIVAVESIFDIECPLTTWERQCRGGSLRLTQNDSFIAHWLGRMIFFDNIDGNAWQFIVGYLTFTALVIWSFWKAPPRLTMTMASFVALVHFAIGGILLTTAWDQNRAVGVCFLVQAALWYGLQNR